MERLMTIQAPEQITINKENSVSYPASAKFFHWAIALIILLNLITGVILVNFYSLSKQLNLFIIHEQCGVTVLMLAILRLIWRLTHKYPSLDGLIAKNEILLAKFGHLLLYALMFAIPICGILLSQSSGKHSGLLWFQLPTLIERDLDLREQLFNLHKYLAILITTIVAGHVIAALKHHFIDKNQILTHMLPWSKNK